MNYELDMIVRIVTCTLILAFFLFLLLRARRSRTFRYFTTFLIVLLIWTAYPLLRYSGVTTIWPWLIPCLGHLYWLSVCFTGYLWLTFCFVYVDQGLRKPRPWYFLLAIPPALSFLAYLTNASHHLFFPAYGIGILYILHTIMSYAYVLVGNVLLLIHALHQYRSAKARSILMIAASLIPLLSSLYQHYYWLVHHYWPAMDPIPIAFCLTIGLFIFVTYKHHFLDILPAAFANIAAFTKEGLLVLDRQDLVVYANPTFSQAFACRPREGQNLGDVLSQLNALMPPEERLKQPLLQTAAPAWEGPMEMAVEADGCLTWYLLSANRIRDQRGQSLGRVLAFTDITAYKQHNEELRSVNEHLAAANAGLARLAAVTEELAAAKERERLSREIHDSLGHALTVLIAMLETEQADKAPAGGEKTARIKNMITVARRGLTELRRVVASGGAVPPEGQRDLSAALQSLVEAFQATGVRVDLTVEGGSPHDLHRHADAVYRICQEALTNSLRHGAAKNIAILLLLQAEAVIINIVDDGSGCAEVKPGFGLGGMQKRVTEFGGKMVYGSLDPRGFQVRVELPMKGVMSGD